MLTQLLFLATLVLSPFNSTPDLLIRAGWMPNTYVKPIFDINKLDVSSGDRDVIYENLRNHPDVHHTPPAHYRSGQFHGEAHPIRFWGDHLWLGSPYYDTPHEAMMSVGFTPLQILLAKTIDEGKEYEVRTLNATFRVKLVRYEEFLGSSLNYSHGIGIDTVDVSW